jgi:superfamily II DNA or RNA helicase
METIEVKEIVAEILNDIKKNNRRLTTRKYESFFSRIGMSQRKNLGMLKEFDKEFRRNGIIYISGEYEYSEISLFEKGQTIIFKLSHPIKSQIVKIKKTPVEYATSENKFNERRVENKNAGCIKIVDEECNISLYKHQEEAINSLQERIIKQNKNHYSGLLVLPTGGGKTLTALYWIAKNYLDKGKKVLWIAHRHELLEQAKHTFHQKLAFKDIFQHKSNINYRIISGIHDKPVNIKPTDDIIISSKDSLNAGFDHLYKNWIKGKSNEVFLVIDEAHHAIAKSYRRLINKLRDNVDDFKMLGLTATPFRTAEDESGLLQKVFPDDIVYKVDLRTLIHRGILSEPIFEEVETEIDMTNILTERDLENIKYFDIETIGRSTAKSIAENDKRNWVIVNRYLANHNKYKQTLVFALNVDNAIALNKLFKEAGIKSEYVLSAIRDKVTGVTISSKENKEKIERFRNKEFDVLINVNILTEGVDVPNVQSVFLARPTISPILMTQMIGRGLRGEKAGGTKEAYIVSFIDDWKDKVAWVNPERLMIEKNIDFNDKDTETSKKIIRLVSINKIEEFAILTNKIIDCATKEELEKLDFIERIPLGIYQFSILRNEKIEVQEKSKVVIKVEEKEKNCEVLVYDNLKESYSQFVSSLSGLFKKYKLSEKDYLTEVELEKLADIVDKEFFYGCLKHPCYLVQDIKDILQFYAQTESEPKYIELKDRENYDIAKVAIDILSKNMGRQDEEDYKSSLWENNLVEWKAFFGCDKRYFLNEIDLAIRKIKNPELFKKQVIVPTDMKELREIEKMSMGELKEEYPEYWKDLSDRVYNKFMDKDKYYYSAISGYKSRNKLDFQIDHIKSMQKGGLTRIDNLQLLTRKENALKGSK